MPAQVDKKTGQTLPESNTIVNIVLIVLGALFVFQGIVLLLGVFGVDLPAFLTSIASGGSGEAANALFGQNSTVTIVLGFWCFIAGIGLFQEQEWAWGQALVVLSVIMANGIGSVIGWASSGVFEAGSLLTWISIISLVISAVIFFYLFFTKKRYA